MTFSLSAQQIHKTYGGVTALAAGNLTVTAGEVVALLGANGSGKSTLTKVITGVVTPDKGQLLLGEQPVSFPSPQAAQEAGIVAVYQELSLIPDMTVAENIWLGHEPVRGLVINQREVWRRTRALLALFEGVVSATLQPDRLVRSLPPDERQIVEILKALSFAPQLIILDEATASLDARQVERLFTLVADWKAQGKAIVFVSHRMEEIFQVADRAVVLRNGQMAGAVPIASTTAAALVELMVGLATPVPDALQASAVAKTATHVRLQVDQLVTQHLRGVDLSVKAGELLGIGGLQGQGQTDLLLALFGAVPFRGQITLDGRAVHFTHPRQAMKHEVAFVPGDRGAEGLLAIRSILENLQLPSWQRYGLPLRMGQARADAGDDAHRADEDAAAAAEQITARGRGDLGTRGRRGVELRLRADPHRHQPGHLRPWRGA